MESEGRRSPSPPPPSSEADIASRSPKAQVSHDAATAPTAGDPPPNATAHHTSESTEAAAFPADDAASHAPQELGVPEATAPSAADPHSDAVPASHHVPQEIGIEEAKAPSSGTLSDDLRDKIVRQVEYYFSDENLPTDKFLLKYVKRNKEGFVPIAVIASFRRMKKLVEDFSLVEAALRTSSQLVVSLDGKKVKRLHPLPVTEIKDAKSQTVIVENLPGDCSTDYIQRIFGKIGNITNITIRNPHFMEESAWTRKAEMTISSKLHALVEFETVEAAESAVATLNDEKNWSGMRVELLLKRMGKFGFIQRGHKEKHSKKNEIQTTDAAADEQKLKSVDHHDEIAETEEEQHVAGGKGARGRRYRGRGRGQLQQNSNGHGRGYVPSSSSGEGASKPIPGPRMPDGTRGFTMGRGKHATRDQNVQIFPYEKPRL